MTWSVQPEPSDENERAALLAGLEQALAEEQSGPPAYAGGWWRAGLDDLRGFDETPAEPRSAKPS